MLFKFLFLKIIKFYQNFLSPNKGILKIISPYPVCRFYPSCSEYAYQSIKKNGVLKGFYLSLKRISKCHPWHPGGIDLP